MWGCCSDAASWISRRNPLGADARPHLRRQDLHHHLPAERHLRGHEDTTHPTAAQLAIEPVGVAERRLEPP